MVDALQRRRVDHPAGVADEHRARHRQLRHRPVAAARQRLRAPRDALAALEDVLDERVHLERLQQVVGRGGRVRVVEVDHEADRDEVLAGLLVLHRVDPRAAELAVLRGDLQRPGLHERVDHAVERLGDLPDLLDAELPDLRLAALRQVELLDRGAGQVTPAALGEHGRLRLDVGAGLEVAERLAVLAAALVAGAHADHAPVLDHQLRRRGLGEDVGAGLLGLALLVARQRRHRDHLVAVVLEVRHRRDRDRQLALRAGEHVDRLLRHLAEREALLAPLLAATGPGTAPAAAPGASPRPTGCARRTSSPSRRPRPGLRRAAPSSPGRPPAAAAAGSRRPGRRSRRRRSRRRPRSARPRRRGRA